MDILYRINFVTNAEDGNKSDAYVVPVMKDSAVVGHD